LSDKTFAPYGLWPSPLQPADLAQRLTLADVGWDSDGRTLVWLEGRSDQRVLVCEPQGEAPRDLTPTRSVRARVGYGGGDFCAGGGRVIYVEAEGRMYSQPLAAGQATPITPQFGHMASPALSPDGKWVVFVHTYERVDGLAIADAAGEQWPQKLAYGTDFCAAPCWHPAGTHIAWMTWDHPNMPWDGTVLKLAEVNASGPGLPVLDAVQDLVAEPDVAVLQPQFSPDGRFLAYLCDATGWLELYLYDMARGTHRQLTSDAVEVGGYTWGQGTRGYEFSADGRQIYYIRNEAGFRRLWACDLKAGACAPVDSPLAAYTDLGQIAVAPQSGRVALIASAPTIGPRVVSWDPSTGEVQVHRRGTSETLTAKDLSTPQPVSWTADDGTTVHGLYYPPTSSRYTGRGLPPGIVNIHGGPTGQSTTAYSPRAQFFATRGYAYLEVNYRGSTGYGKAYRDMLRGKWGLLDVEDAVGGARYLSDAGLADPAKLVIMGGSAGGYTVLETLVDHPGTFKAALCLYGVSNMFTLAADTHKLEERYLDSMLGPLPEASQIYRDRSPIYRADRIVDPIAVFQGDIDRVVPRAQSDTIVASLQRRGVPHEYHVYEGEGHGWRKRETLEAFYKAVEAFLKTHLIYA
jgi:dipeptidyl aminopeptidase/acylaminoacyl peptidase